MRRFVIATVVAILLAQTAPGAEPLQWVKKPELTFDAKAKKWYATFELNALTDVELALIESVQNVVIRHLAAGVRGPKAPPPFVAYSRLQKLEWDGKDDYRMPVPNAATVALGVRAGMSVALKPERYLGGHQSVWGDQGNQGRRILAGWTNRPK